MQKTAVLKLIFAVISKVFKMIFNHVESFHKKSLLMENFMNRHLKSELAKLVPCFFFNTVNIWKFSRIMLMNFSAEFLITVI